MDTPETQPPPPMTDRDRVVNLSRQLAGVQSWVRMVKHRGDLHPGRFLQADELIETIEETLAANGDPYLLARVELLETVGSQIHQLTSNLGLPDLLREAAAAIENVRARLDSSGFTEWNDIGFVEKQVKP